MEPFADGLCQSNASAPLAAAENAAAKNRRDDQLLGQDDQPLDRDSLEEDTRRDQRRYSGMRTWRRCKKERAAVGAVEPFALRLVSFNILAQHLLEMHPHLYKRHARAALRWPSRRRLILAELLAADAHVACLQEVQQDHLAELLGPLEARGYRHLYKKRTNEKRDGLLLLWRGRDLELLEATKLELYQSGVELLSRDNVAIVARFAVGSRADAQIVVATTHLLYNPKRNDVRLGQTQLLLAEIERIAFVENTSEGARYLPIILAGDFNLEPHTGVYEFITRGRFEYRGKGRNLEAAEYRKLSNSLIPARLCVTDGCQHFGILRRRLLGDPDGRVMLENTESGEPIGAVGAVGGVNVDSTEPQLVPLTPNLTVGFSTGVLTHPFAFRSAYPHEAASPEPLATTNQGEWITVDYIFHTGTAEPVELYRLPGRSECEALPTIPNFAVGSDHLCLGATFRIVRSSL